MINLRPPSPLFGSQFPRAFRPFYAPVLTTPPILGAVAYEEDFLHASFGPVFSGGCHDWTSTVVAGTGYVNQSAETFLDNAQGVMRILAQGVNGITILEQAAGSSASADINVAKQSFWNTSECLWAFRFQMFGALSLLTSSVFGIGLPGTNNGVPNIGTDWATDPDTSLDSAVTGVGTGIVVTRHSAAYGGANAGALVIRLYNASHNSILELDPAPIASQWYKVEIYKPGGSGAAGAVFNIYLDGVFKGTLTAGNIDTDPRFSMVVKTIAGAIRNLTCDWYYQEIRGANFAQR